MHDWCQQPAQQQGIEQIPGGGAEGIHNHIVNIGSPVVEPLTQFDSKGEAKAGKYYLYDMPTGLPEHWQQGSQGNEQAEVHDIVITELSVSPLQRQQIQTMIVPGNCEVAPEFLYIQGAGYGQHSDQDKAEQITAGDVPDRYFHPGFSDRNKKGSDEILAVVAEIIYNDEWLLKDNR